MIFVNPASPELPNLRAHFQLWRLMSFFDLSTPPRTPLDSHLGLMVQRAAWGKLLCRWSSTRLPSAWSVARRAPGIVACSDLSLVTPRLFSLCNRNLFEPSNALDEVRHCLCSELGYERLVRRHLLMNAIFHVTSMCLPLPYFLRKCLLRRV